MKTLLLALPLAFTLVACGGGDSDTPNVADRYQEGIQRAWDLAENGESPTTRCAVVTGAAVGNARADGANQSEAAAAYEACYVDVHAHWVHQRLAQADNAPTQCLGIMTGLMSSRMSLGSMADEFDLELDDLNRKLSNKISSQIEQHCPDLVTAILGEHT